MKKYDLKITHANGKVETSTFDTLEALNAYDLSIYGEEKTINENNEETINWTKEIIEVKTFETISPRQIRLALLGLGITQENVKSLIALLPSPTNEQALIAWEYSTFFDRNAPLVENLGNQLGLTTEQLDAVWEQAKSL